MKKFLFKYRKIKELPYHYDIVTPYIRFKYMTDVFYNRMIEFGVWWWRFEIHYQRSQTFKSGIYLRRICTIIILVRAVLMTQLKRLKNYVQSILSRNKEE